MMINNSPLLVYNRYRGLGFMNDEVSVKIKVRLQIGDEVII